MSVLVLPVSHVQTLDVSVVGHVQEPDVSVDAVAQDHMSQDHADVESTDAVVDSSDDVVHVDEDVEVESTHFIDHVSMEGTYLLFKKAISF